MPPPLPPAPPTKRARVRILLAAGACAASFGIAAAAGCRESHGPALPNVLMIVMDTTRADHCSVTGGPRATTPNLEALAADGVRFMDAWAPAGWTAPSHASLFTGLLPERHQVDTGLRMHLDEEIPTLASLLKSAGWETGCFSNNENVGPVTGLSRGFDRFQPLYQEKTLPYPTCDVTHRRAADWMRGVERAGGRFFAFVNVMEPHLPYTPPDDVAQRFLPDDATWEELSAARSFDYPMTLPVIAGRRVLTDRERTILSALYDAEIATLDASLGRLFAELRTSGLLDRTLVVVCSDHGENLGDHGLVHHRFSLHRSIRHVPLVMRLPGSFDGGRVVRSVVRLHDVFPTVLEACGVEPPAGIDARSLAPVIAEAPPAPPRDAPAFHGPLGDLVEPMRNWIQDLDTRPFEAAWHAVYDGRFHLIRASDGRTEFYDVSADPAETRNLAPAGGPDMERLERMLNR